MQKLLLSVSHLQTRDTFYLRKTTSQASQTIFFGLVTNVTSCHQWNKLWEQQWV